MQSLTNNKINLMGCFENGVKIIFFLLIHGIVYINLNGPYIK